MPKNMAIPARRSSGSPVGSQMNSADSDSNDGHLGRRSDREWRRQYGPAIGAEVVQRLPCGWRRGCRSLRLRAQLCFDRGNVFQYWRTKLVFAQEHGAGLEAWQTRTRCETLTPSILVRIQVPQPYHLLILLCLVSFRLRRNSSDMSAGYARAQRPVWLR